MIEKLKDDYDFWLKECRTTNDIEYKMTCINMCLTIDEMIQTYQKYNRVL